MTNRNHTFNIASHCTMLFVDHSQLILKQNTRVVNNSVKCGKRSVLSFFLHINGRSIGEYIIVI